MSLIAEKHDALLSCLQKIYDVLLEMRYISKDDIVQPPQTTNAILDDTLQGLGYESEVIELIKLMPALRGEIAWGYRNDGTELTPRSKAVSYLIDQNSEWTEYLRWGDHVMSPDHKILPAWMLRLTIGNMEPSQYGTDLLYDIRECMCCVTLVIIIFRLAHQT